MKKLLSILAFAIAASVGFGAVSVGDVKVSQATSASPVAFKDIIITPAANSVINFNGSLVPSASGNFTLGGAMLLGNATGGLPATAGVINAKGFQIDGVPVGASTDTYWSTVTGGISYTAGTTLQYLSPSTTFSAATGPNLSSTLSSRAPRQGWVFPGTGTTSASWASTTLPSAIGTTGYTVHAVGSTTLGSDRTIIDAVGFIFIRVTSGGAIRIYDRAATAELYNPGTGLITAGKTYAITYSRGVGLFLNGVLVSSTITDASNYTATNIRIGAAASDDNIWSGPLTVGILNRSLSAAEVVSLYETGAPASSDLNSASNTASLISAGAASTLASDASYWTLLGTPAASFSGGKLVLGSTSYIRRTGLFTVGRKYRYSIDVTDYTSGNIVIAGAGTLAGPFTSSGTKTGEFTADSADINIGASGAGVDATLNNVAFYPLGCLLYTDPLQPGRGTIAYAAPGTSANVTLGTGVSWAVPSSSTISLGTVAANQATIAGDASGGLTVASPINTAYGNGANLLSSSLSSGNRLLINFGKALANDQAGWMSYLYNSTPASTQIGWGHYGTVELMTLSKGGQLSIPATTASTSTNSGALVVGGGVGIGGKVYTGSDVNIAPTSGSANLNLTSADTNPGILNFTRGTVSTSLGQTVGSINFYNTAANRMGLIASEVDAGGAANNGRIVMWTNNAGTLTEQFRLGSTGNLTVLGTGAHTFGTGSTVTLAAGAVTATGVIKSTATTQAFSAEGATTAARIANFSNTGGQLFVGVERSSGGEVITGTTGYAGIIATNNATDLQLGTNGTTRLTLSAAGAATFAGAVTTQSGRTVKVTVDTGTSLTLDATHHAVTLSNGSAVTVNLPAVSGITGRQYMISNRGAGTVTIDANASETINGATTKTLAQYDSVILVCSGTDWVIF